MFDHATMCLYVCSFTHLAIEVARTYTSVSQEAFIHTHASQHAAILLSSCAAVQQLCLVAVQACSNPA